MRIKEYQMLAASTDQNPRLFQPPQLGQAATPQKDEIIPLLGLVGEVGGLLSEYKKMLRDGAVHEQFNEMLAEELGDILWYVSTVATKFGIDLETVAKDNLTKIDDRWHSAGGKRKLYDSDLKPSQQLPRKFSFTFTHTVVGEVEKLVLIDNNNNGAQVGDPLTDNSYEDDGYRYHDVMHLAFMTHLGWSPVIRKLLRTCKYIEKRPPEIDESQDSGRPQVIDEGLVAAIYVYADNHQFLKGLNSVDWQLLRHIKQMTSKLEVKNCTTGEWNAAIISGVKIWKKLIDNKGGIVSGNLETGELTFTKLT